jgi:hypothetical protein
MATSKRAGDPGQVVRETWYEYSYSAVVSERYADGGVLFFIHTWDGDRRPFSNIKSLNEEGVVVTKEEAMQHLERTKSMIEGYSASASPPE